MPLLYFGIACLIAAVAGGEVKALGAEIPELTTFGQVLIGVIGLLLLVVAFVIPEAAARSPEAIPRPPHRPEREPAPPKDPVSKYDLDLDAAWSRVLSEAWTDQVPDILRWDDYKLAWSDWKKELTVQLDADTYVPKRPLTIDLPKDALVTRPLVLLSPKDRTVYEAVVDRFVPAIESALPDEVMSMRIDVTKTGGGRLQKQSEAWAQYQQLGRRIAQTGKLSHLGTTDIAAYFQFIRTDALVDALNSLPDVEESHTQLLGRILSAFEEIPDVWGLPQGPNASNILGNVYLIPADRVLATRPLQFLRFQDDIKLFSDNELELRVALRDLEKACRAQRLAFSVHKTRVIHGSDVLKEFEDERKDVITYGLKIGSSDTRNQIHQLFDEAVGGDHINVRDLRFAIYRLERLLDPHAVTWILDNLHRTPYLASLLADYLDQHFARYPLIEKRVREYLENTRVSLYAWTELHLIRLLSRASSINAETYEMMWHIVGDEQRHPLVRQHAARCLGRHGDPAELTKLKTLAHFTEDLPLKRALVVAVTEGQGEPDSAWLAKVAESAPELRCTCDYLQLVSSLPAP